MHSFAVSRTMLAFAFTAALFITAGCGNEHTRQVDALFERWDRPDSPGCALGIVRDGRLIYERGYGMANLEHDVPLSSTSVLRIASTSKQFAAMSLLLLEQDGKLSLDDDIREHLPAMPDYGQPVTIRHLMHHSSGIRDYADVMYLKGIEENDDYLKEEVLDLLASQRALNFAPGERYLYSNSGYLLMGEIVERVSGRTLRQFTDERIFQPLGMRSTHFHDDNTMIVRERATGYSPREGDGFRIDESPLELVGDGSLFTTVKDLYLWDQNFYHHEIGGEAAAAAQHEPLVLNDGRRLQYAAALEIGTYGGLRLVSHSGSWVGFRAQLLRFPDQRFSVICLCNDGSASPTALALRVADIYLAEQFKSPPLKPAVGHDGTGEASAISNDPAALAGLYREPTTHAVWKVAADGSGLSIEEGWDTGRYAPVGPMTFRSADEDAGFPTDLVFRETSGTVPPRFQVLAIGEVPQTFERIDPVTPSLDQLREYTGTYYSEELEVVHRIVLEDGDLYIKYRKSPHIPLEPAQNDQFTMDWARIEFERDSQDKVLGYGVWIERAWDVRFARVDD